MKFIAYLIYIVNLKYLSIIKKYYYKLLFKKCGSNLLIYGCANIKNPQNITLGDNCSINDNVYLNGLTKIDIGNNVAISASAMIISTGLNVDEFILSIKSHNGKGIKIGNNVQVGAGAIILDGVTIGNNVIVGANSLVAKNISSNLIVAGVPAKIIRELK